MTRDEVLRRSDLLAAVKSINANALSVDQLERIVAIIEEGREVRK
jgi:hypothetical protein